MPRLNKKTCICGRDITNRKKGTIFCTAYCRLRFFKEKKRQEQQKEEEKKKV